ncbi:MAG: hypothetical protein ACYDEO_06435 [Aggregatilineales bacterium]
MIRLLGRVVAVLLVLLIIPTTVFAFWLFNLDRVLLDPNTYKSGLHNDPTYANLMTAVLSGFAANNSTPRNAGLLLNSLPPPAWDQISQQVFPPGYAQKQIDGVIDQLNNWISGSSPQPNVKFSLAELKANLSGPPAVAALKVIPANLPRCTADQIKRLQAFGDTDGFDKLPICDPGQADLRTMLETQLAAGLALIDKQLPDQWTLAEELNTIDVHPGIRGPGHMDPFVLEQARAGIWLQSRLMVTLFLIPIALLCLIVIVTIRSGKGFFRWLGWALILSGFVSLLPVLLMPMFGAADAKVAPFANDAAGVGELALNALARAVTQSVISTLAISVLLQVAALIVVGLAAVFVSVLLKPSEPELTDDEWVALMAAQTPEPLPVAHT